MPLRRFGHDFRNKPRKPLVLLLRLAKSWPKPAKATLCDEASAAMQEHGFWKAKLFCGVSMTIVKTINPIIKSEEENA